MELFKRYFSRVSGRIKAKSTEKVCKRMESRGSGNGSRQEDGIAKVVRIPRDWFGPVDELVPIGRPASDADSAPLDPNTFWDGSSSSIQDAVERPRGEPSDEAPVELGRVPYPPVGRVSRTAGIRSLVASVAVLLVVGASIAGWLLGKSHAKPGSSTLASITSKQGPELTMRRFNWSYPSATGTQGGPKVRVSRALRDGRARHKTSSPSPASVTDVVYRATSTGQPSPATTGYRPQTAAQGSSTASTSGSSAATASISPAKQSSPTTFGASGALGPMSSPDG